MAARRADRCRRDRGHARADGPSRARRRCPRRRRMSGTAFRRWCVGAVPGALLFVRQGDRSYTVTGGYADKATRRPMRAGDAFPIGSTTKTFTAVLVMRLVAQGKIALDAPVSKYLPGLLSDGKRITIRELLSHTSGLDDYTSDTRFIAPYLQGNFGRAWTPRQMVAFAASQPRAFAPGTSSRTRTPTTSCSPCSRSAWPASPTNDSWPTRSSGRSSSTTRACRRTTGPCRTSTATSARAPRSRAPTRLPSTAPR